ncbi:MULTISPECIES: TIGR04222 domain-containing membrane protein [Nostoc]|uniref:TIGR04222 domain-containing membrane protein n=2 Tax=Nostoc TaxID=1177 RepID=A0ABR8IIG1_9NOSO|nr:MULTISPECIES: TIGR04222 domain-containing membrane protein [Nostoc]MBD2565146.1 TIGR04222 domain-containing membrane protein [Nostoc linckia FACHB-391]MBD2650781.1 TIGR04222 domain-containing membrane protein [Nostoc foliaceum FACHB-393]
MNALLHNPIADMYGPDFLLFYCSVVVITLVVCWRLVQDPTKNQPLPLIPAEPDPYEIAYLRSQETGIADVALFDLIVRGYLQFSEQSISQVPNHPDASHLQPIEREIFDKLSSSSTVQTSLWLATQSIQTYSNAYEEKLQNEQLLYASQWQERNIKVGLIGAMIIFSLGGYKLLIALGKGRSNVGFLVAIGVLSIIFLLWFVSRHTPLSHRGKIYLQQLQQTFTRLQQKAKYDIPSVFDYNLLVALFGVEALAGTSYDSYYKAFFPPIFSRTVSTGSRSSGGSCSSSSGCSSSCSSSSSDSSCSSSSCSSSSCGGGCGGGCGGCGGG